MEERLGEGRDGSGTLAETINDPLAEQAYEHVLDTIERRAVRDLTGQLDEREQVVIRAHFGLGQPAQTFSQIGGTLGLTAEQARQIQVGALHKLREALAQPAPLGRGRLAFGG